MPAFRGTLVDTPTIGKLRVRSDHVLVVDEKGYIASVIPADEAAPEQLSSAVPLGPYTFLLPAFADLHLHAPQYLNAGMGLDLPLMQWLDTYTYPAEERVDAEPALAARLYARLAARLLDAGTAAALFFGTLGVEANLELARACLDAGLRGYVGKLSMDLSPRPSYGEASAEASVAAVEAFLARMEELVAPLPPHRRLVRPVLTPRFVPTCSDALLSALGSMAAERGLMVQSHMCESRDQMAWVCATRAERADENVFDAAGLLGPRTVQAHVTTFPPALMQRVIARGTAVAHCPLSNAYFSDAAFPLREAIDAGVKIGLGSDVAGGYALSVHAAMRQAVVVARLREGARREAAAEAGAIAPAHEAIPGAEADAGDTIGDTRGDTRGLRVDWVKSLYFATRGGMSVLGLGGAFEAGMPFDAQQITLASDDGGAVGPLDFFDLPGVRPEERFWREAVERWWCLGDERNRSGMWVQGRRVR